MDEHRVDHHLTLSPQIGLKSKAINKHREKSFDFDFDAVDVESRPSRDWLVLFNHVPLACYNRSTGLIALTIATGHWIAKQ